MLEILTLKKELAAACESIYEEELVKHGEGNISIRVPDKEEMVISPSGNDYSNPLPINMVHVSFEGENFDGLLAPSSEYFMHRAVYRARPKASCVLHTHSPYAAALAVTHQDLPVIIEEMAIQLGGGVKCAPYAPAGTENLPKVALETMGDQNAVLLANHGVLVVGNSPEYCIKVAVIIEKMAEILLHARLSGEVHEIPLEYQEKFIKVYKERYSTV